MSMNKTSSFKTVAMLDAAAIAKFSGGLTGYVILPADLGYEKARWSWNRAVDRHPGMIVRCATNDDVVRAVEFARNNDLLLAVRSGGHSFAGQSTCDGGMLIDFSAMKSMHVDPPSRIARAQAGVKVGEFDRATQTHGLATVMGGCEDVGIGGLTLGGGLGLLSGRYGLPCDNLLSVEVVTADGRLLKANDREHEDLFWGMRGGAGNFGVVTTLEYRLHSVNQIFGGAVVYPIESLKQVLRCWRDYSSDPPEELTTVFGIAMMPAGPVIGILGCWCGDLDQGQRALRPLTSFGSPLMNSLDPMSYLDLQHSIEEFNPTQVSAYRKSNFFKELSDEAVDVIAEHIRLRAPDSFFFGLHPYRGAICRVGTSETAFPIRERGYDLWIDAYWQQSSETERSRDWANNFWNAMRRFTTGAVYVNNLSDEGQECAQSAYGANYDRLVALKNKYDPTNLFRMNQNIKPAGIL
jgi:hypothetical protein